MSPPEGPIAGGTNVVVKGSDIRDAEWQVDRVAISPLSRTNSEVRLQMPAHDNGIASLSARSATGVAYAEYLYIPPRLDELPPRYITTVAGIGPFIGDGRIATRAMVIPVDVAVAPDGSIYIADQEYHRVRRIRLNSV